MGLLEHATPPVPSRSRQEAVARAAAIIGSTPSSSRSPPSAEATLTPTQQAIRSILKPDPAQSFTDAFFALTQLERRPMPDTTTTAQLAPHMNPRCSCYDASNGLARAWSAHRVCQRCKLLNQLTMSCAHSASAASVQALIGSSIHATDCVSEHTQDAQTPVLPIELVDMIVDFAIAGMRKTQDGSAVAKLLHVSSLIRYKIVQEFEQVVLQEDVARQRVGPSTSGSVLMIPFPVSWAVWNAAQECFMDCSLRRHGKERLQLIADTTVVISRQNQSYTGVKCDVMIETEDEHGTIDVTSKSCFQQADLDSHTLDVADVFEAIQQASRDEGARLSPRRASIYHRAAHDGKFTQPRLNIRFTIKLKFICDGSDGYEKDETSVSWSFVNVHLTCIDRTWGD